MRGEERRDGETPNRAGPIFCQDRPGSILLPQKKRNKKTAGRDEGRPLTLPKCQRYAQKCTKHSASRSFGPVGAVGSRGLRSGLEWDDQFPNCSKNVQQPQTTNDGAKRRRRRRLRLQHYVYAVVHRWKKETGTQREQESWILMKSVIVML